MNNISVLAVQHEIVWEDRLANFRKLEQLIMPVKEPVDLVVLPEFFALGFSENMGHLAESADGATCKWMNRLARSMGAVVCGTVPLITSKGVVNRFLWVAPDGQTAWYDKAHLFAVGGETQHLVKGNSRTVVEIDEWRLMPQVCYDLRFPVFCRNSYSGGSYAYDVLVFTANWPASRSHHWRSLLVARAIENQCYVVGVNRTGVDGNGLVHQGDTLVVDYKGNMIAGAVDDAPQTVLAYLSLESLQEWRVRFPVAHDWDTSWPPPFHNARLGK